MADALEVGGRPLVPEKKLTVGCHEEQRGRRGAPSRPHRILGGGDPPSRLGQPDPVGIGYALRTGLPVDGPRGDEARGDTET